MDLIPPTHKIKRRNSLHGLIFRRGSDPYSLTPPRSHPVCVCVHIQYYFAYTIMEHSFCALVNYTRKYTFSDILLTLFASTAKVSVWPFFPALGKDAVAGSPLKSL